MSRNRIDWPVNSSNEGLDVVIISVMWREAVGYGEPPTPTLFNTDHFVQTSPRVGENGKILTESLILAQDERWRRA